MPSNYQHIYEEHQADYGRKLTVWAQDHLANRYGDRTHFIFELLQNAEDALGQRENGNFPSSVSFSLMPDGLEVRHFGKLFSPGNVKSICAINESTKKDDLTEIGCFGIGFKSVYAFTKSPEVHSGDEHFAIEGFVLPVAVPPRPVKEGETLFWIPFSPEDVTAVDEIATALRSLGARRLLFLKSVTEITWSLPDGTTGLFFKNPPTSNQGFQRINLLGEVAGTNESTEENWLLFSGSVEKPDGRPAGSVEIAFQLNTDDPENIHIQGITDSKLVVFFPTEMDTGLGFLIQGPYRTTPSRDVIPKNDQWNRRLVDETAKLLISALHSLRDAGHLNAEALETLPIQPNTFPSHGMLRPLFDVVVSALKTEKLLPAYSGGFRSGQECRLARGEGLRELLSPRQLAVLMSETNDLYWISDEITQDKTSGLHEFLVKHVGVVEITPASLVSRLRAEFFQQQSDDWMKRFYIFLSGQKAMLRDLLKRGTPFILRDDDSLVPPKLGELPQAFLPSGGVTGFRTVKASVCDSENVLEFLRSLGLSTPDPVDDVIQNVLCHYTNITVSRSETEYESDLVRIHEAFATDSDQAKRKLLDGLRSVHFVKAVNAKTGNVQFLKPMHVYRATQRMRTVFEGVDGVWIVDDRVAGQKGDRARNLFQACGVLDVFRTITVDGQLIREEKEELRVKVGAEPKTWDRIEGDAECPELTTLIAAMGSMTSEVPKERATELWLLLRDTLRDRHESYFQARYIWGFGQRAWSSLYPASWIRALQLSRWIPNSSGHLCAPTEICVSDADEKIREAAHPFLTEILGFRPEAIKELAAKEGIDLETLNLLKRHKVSAQQLRAFLGETEEKDDTEGKTSGGDDAEDKGDSGDVGTNGDDKNDDKDKGCEDSEGNGGQSGKQGSGYGGSGGTSGGSKGAGVPKKHFHTYVSVQEGSDPDDDENLTSDERKAIEASAIDFIVGLEPQLERTPTNNPGFDLFEGESLAFVARYVEVKSKKGAWSGAVALSGEQFRLAENEQERFWLYVVEHAQDPVRRQLHKIQDPAGKSKYFTFDSGWKAIAAATQQEPEGAGPE